MKDSAFGVKSCEPPDLSRYTDEFIAKCPEEKEKLPVQVGYLSILSLEIER